MRARLASQTGLACAAALLALACAQTGHAPDDRFSPSDVVRIQLEALADEDEDAGIARTFAFASPSNRSTTGPLPRFKRLVRSPAYRPLLGHVEAEYGRVFVQGGTAVQAVAVEARDGSRHAYLFHLSRQDEGACTGCWMTDSVVRLSSEEEPGVRI
ncbi:MAG: DUF4864 domain-containing protein [Myxococcota bacterium]|nr:DUF4864 domain-containing protein [Myxococcota bacterium]